MLSTENLTGTPRIATLSCPMYHCWPVSRTNLPPNSQGPELNILLPVLFGKKKKDLKIIILLWFLPYPNILKFLIYSWDNRSNWYFTMKSFILNRKCNPINFYEHCVLISPRSTFSLSQELFIRSFQCFLPFTSRTRNSPIAFNSLKPVFLDRLDITGT